MKNILILEDDRQLNDGIKLALENPDYRFFQCYKIKEAQEISKTVALDLILLDLNLPDGYGLDFLKAVRAVSDTPIIIITANNMESDTIIGLEAGANDYITKPFSLMILRARAAVQLRQNTKSNSFTIDNMQFDFDKMRFSVAGEAIELSKTEQRLLHLLLNNRGATLKRSDLIDKIWSGDTQYVDAHALTVAIKRLRGKIEPDPSQPTYIKTVYGLGYSWGGSG
ncbi:response regulator transcription factor [Enterococcus sp. 669A]|uniref:Response regulator transcription factor n=1 Tax=Candidatus Enterococcus moelleringii TaxID=2815325 RepID=A0ABS3L571_9ENTE|nr:response regulator transcription factor [Enterococcus sp. 669A]